MKRFNYIFRTFLVVLLINLTTETWAQDEPAISATEVPAQGTLAGGNAYAWLDSVDISLLTCGPGDEVWSYYGHTALRVEDKAHGTDMAVNWGMFSFGQDYFILRFVFGMTDYQIGVFPMADFIAEYASQGRWVKQQRIRLSRGEKLRIVRAIEENARPENRTYRYNFFYDNCTTRARNMLVSHIGPKNIHLPKSKTYSSYRGEIHKWNENHRWARFGNDLLLGYFADRGIDRQEWEFLPDNLSHDFAVQARADIDEDADMFPAAKKRRIALVDTTFYVVAPQAEVAESEPVTPKVAFLCFALVILVLCGVETWKKKNFWWLDTALFVLTGLPGFILLAMVFSQHPTVQVNFQMLILNPLNLFFVWKVAKMLRKGKMHWYYHAWAAMLLFALVLDFCQNYAEGMNILALSLLLRHEVRTALYNRNKKKLLKK